MTNHPEFRIIVQHDGSIVGVHVDLPPEVDERLATPEESIEYWEWVERETARMRWFG